MNVRSLIHQIKLRPQMFVGNDGLEAVHHFISGFLYNNFATNRVDAVDLAFKEQFHGWVKNKLENENRRFELSFIRDIWF